MRCRRDHHDAAVRLRLRLRDCSVVLRTLRELLLRWLRLRASRAVESWIRRRRAAGGVWIVRGARGVVVDLLKVTVVRVKVVRVEVVRVNVVRVKVVSVMVVRVKVVSVKVVRAKVIR